METPYGVGDNDPYQLAFQFRNFERRIHLPHVEFTRVVVHSAPLTPNPASQGLPFPSSEHGERPYAGGGSVLGWPWGWFWRHQTTTGRSGKSSYRGVLMSEDITLTRSGGYALKIDSPLMFPNVGGINSHLGPEIWEMMRIGVRDRLFNLAPSVRPVNKLLAGAPVYLRGAGNRQMFIREACREKINQAEDNANKAWLCSNRCKPLPYGIAGGVVISALAWINPILKSVIEWAEKLGETLQQQQDECANDPEAESCCVWMVSGVEFVTAVGALAKLEKQWSDPESMVQQWFRQGTATGDIDEALDIADIAENIAKLADLVAYHLRIDFLASSVAPDAAKLLLAEAQRPFRHELAMS